MVAVVTAFTRSNWLVGFTDPVVLDAITYYTKLFWIHTGPFNNLTARKFVLNCTPDAFEVMFEEPTITVWPMFWPPGAVSAVSNR